MFGFNKANYPHLIDVTTAEDHERMYDLAIGCQLEDCTKEELIVLVYSQRHHNIIREANLMAQISEMARDFECLKRIRFMPKRAMSIIKKWVIGEPEDDNIW